LQERLNEDIKELEKIKEKLRKRPQSQFYNDLKEVYERSIAATQEAINWLLEET